MTGGQWKSAVALGVATLLGATCAYLVIPRLFAKVDTDLERTRFLLKSIRDFQSAKTPPPAIVVLGNSVTMNGVDTALISEDLPDKPIAYNFSSTGQSVAEGYLYIQELPTETKTVVLVVSPGNLEDDTLPPEDVYNTFYMQGYRPIAKTLDTLDSAFKGVVDPKDPQGKTFDLGQFRRNEIQQRFRSRWAIAQVPDTEFRKRLRKDLETSKSIKSLTYPAPYTKPIAPKNFEILLPSYTKGRKSSDFSPLPTQEKLIAKMAEQLQAEGRKLFIVLAPMHPRRLSFAGPRFAQSIAEWAGKDPFHVPILNLTDTLKADQFLDVVHPSRAGAEIISAKIAAFLDGEGA